MEAVWSVCPAPAAQLGAVERGNPERCTALCHLQVANGKEKNVGFYRKIIFINLLQ